MNKILESTLNPSDSIEKALYKKYIKIKNDTTFGRLSRILEKEPYVVVVADRREDGLYLSILIHQFFLNWICFRF